MDLKGRVERGGELLRAMLGPERVERTRQVWRELCPDFEAYVVEFLSGEIWSRPGLDLRTKSLVTVATLTALGRPRALELNLRMALNNGATRQDLVETLLQIAPYAGFPACWEGLTLAQKVFLELDSGPRATEDDSPRDGSNAPGPDPAT
ncbi:MAG: carboxymuconolactone decarboxylase family protein [Planctomycetaceae bacterium]|nr:carboxymuconolactone decarboxylase family protein [Planctomycetaceae bacterium]